MRSIFSTCLLFTTAVSVFGQSVELHGILGQSVKFPAAVKKVGSLMHSGVTIGDVTNGKFTTPPNERFNGRLHWDSSTGLFSLSGLKMEDIGEYKVQNTDQNINTVFQLNVYKDNVPVSKPHITITHNEYPCTIVCTVERGTGVILSWYREGEKRYGSSDSLDAPYLKLPQTVETHGIYICEARNSVSNETSDPLTVGAHCTAVSVFGILGESVKFPAAVKKKGSLMHSSGTIGDVTEGSFTALPIEKFSGRLHWDSSTGLFSLSGLKMEDSGEYKVQNTDQNIITIFQLNVYKDNVPVSKPHVSLTHNEYPCTIECTAERGTGVTLSWYREGEKKSLVSSRVASALHLHLPVPVESGTYTCEAKNSVSRETSDPLTVGAHCTANPIMWILIAVVVLLFLAIVAYCLRRRICRFIRRRRAVRTLIQVKKLLDNVDLHAYGETRLELSPDAVRTVINVKKLLDNLDLHAYGETRLELSPDGETRLELSPDGETRLELSPDAVRTVINVKMLLDNLDLHAYAQYLFDHENSEASDETIPLDVKELLDDVDLYEYGKCTFTLYICRKTNPA
ncbi:titin-like isoform X1 [Anguilla anguilla]|uniref:titin-like isoform X1 n=1 Tax=Anguilla anguilla TaxID=7936 RepID=UPI0015AB52AB|nr:titin-like isoform X1 [Anguilla anguilla]